MTALIPLAYEDHLIRAIERDGEPWFVGRDVCDVLGLEKADTAIARLDPDEKAPHTVGTLSSGARGGGPQVVTIISEPGVYRLVFTSRKPEAERFKRWLAHEVIPALRKHGFFAMPGAEPPLTINERPSEAPLLTRLAILREARIVYGIGAAKAMWPKLGLPEIPVPPAPDPAEDPGQQCLVHLLSWQPPDALPVTVVRFLDAALEGEARAVAQLIEYGIRVQAGGRQGIVVANRHPALTQCFEGTAWSGGRHVAALRTLPGTKPVGCLRFGDQASRGTFLPAELTDSLPFDTDERGLG